MAGSENTNSQCTTVPRPAVGAVSSSTKPLLDRLIAAASDPGNRQVAAIVDEVLVAIKSDEFILNALQTDLEHFRKDQAVAASVERAIQRCKEVRIEARVTAANAALLGRATDKAVILLHNVAKQDVTFLPDAVRQALFRLYVSIAWASQDPTQTEAFLTAAQALDHDRRFEAYLNGLSRLLEARNDVQRGKYDLAARQCYTLRKESKPNDPLCLMALELMSDAFRRMGDAKREMETLEEWQKLCAGLPNGPCDLAVNAETTEQMAGVMGGSRAEEVLQHYSRLAFLYEREPGHQAYAKPIYRHFLNVAYHSWVDPQLPQPTTIKERLDALEAPRSATVTRVESTGVIAILEPKKSYGHVSDQMLAELLDALSKPTTPSSGAVVVHCLDMKEKLFPYQPSLGTPVVQLLSSLSDVCTEKGGSDLRFEPRQASVQWKAGAHDWILLSHNNTAREIADLEFGIEITPSGKEIELAVRVLFAYVPPVNNSARNLLSDLLRRKPADWTGYASLQKTATELIRTAARRLGQKNAASGTNASGEPQYEFLQ